MPAEIFADGDQDYIEKFNTVAQQAFDGDAAAGRLDAHIAGTADKHAASAIVSTPAGNIAATNVQSAITELDNEKQPVNSNLTALAGQTGAADKVSYWTAAATLALTTLSSFGRTMIAWADAAAARTGLGLGTLATLNDAPAGSLTGATLAAGVTASSLTSVGTLTSLTTSGQITSSLSTGAAPFSVASTTNVANLNASSLSGATFAAPGTIGGTTPSAATFTTLTTSGSVGVGASAPAFIKLYVAGTLPSSSTASRAVEVAATIPSTSTAQGFGYNTNLSTEAAAFTLTTLAHYRAGQGTIGAGSAVAQQYGFFAENSLTGAATNIGFYSNIASAANRYNFYAAGTADNVFVGQTSLGGAAGAEGLRVLNFASLVNRWQLYGNTTGSAPRFYVEGSDTNITGQFSGKGTGALDFLTNTFTSLQFRVLNTPSAVNWLQATGAATGSYTIFSTQGSDTNIFAQYWTKGSGAHDFVTSAGTALQLRIAHTPSAVNYAQITGGATGTAVTVSAQGSDANINFTIAAKGAGVVSLSNALVVNSDSIRIVSTYTPPTAASGGTQGQIVWDANYVYVCTATNTWKRAALSTW